MSTTHSRERQMFPALTPSEIAIARRFLLG